MAKPTKLTYEQDTFDKAFIKVLYELQTIGFCKNISALEEYLDIPKRTLYEVNKGRRGVPMMHRTKLQKFFSETYGVNPRVFTNHAQPTFKGAPPVLDDVEEPFTNGEGAKARNRLTAGDMLQFDRMQMELAALKERNKELEKEVKYWRDLAQKTLGGPQKAAAKPAKRGNSKR